MIEKNDNIKIINKSSYLLSQLIRIWDHLSVYYKRQYKLVSILMVFATLVEVINLGAVVPFLGIITAPDQFFAKPFLKPFINFFQISEPNQLRLPLTILFIFSALFSSIIRSFLIFSMNRLSFSTGTYLSIDIYRRTLYQDYSVHVSRNSSEVINGIISKTSTVIHGVISPVLVFISYFVQLIIIITAVFLINYTFTLIIFFVFGTLYLLIIRLVLQSKIQLNI